MNEPEPSLQEKIAFFSGLISAAAGIREPIILTRPYLHLPCPCTAVHSSANGEVFHAVEDGLYQHDGVQWRRIADFRAVLHESSFDNPEVPARLIVKRAGRYHLLEVPRHSMADSGWIADALGDEAVKSVTDYQALRRAIVFLGFSYAECGGCLHER
jgi:hypothetical protein